MIIVGCTSKPEAGDAKEFKNFFQKFLYVPAPDYASRLMLWHHFIRERLEQVTPPPPSSCRHSPRPYRRHATRFDNIALCLRQRQMLFSAKLVKVSRDAHASRRAGSTDKTSPYFRRSHCVYPY